jgi:membrane protease YdiL (CAAX protease family)
MPSESVQQILAVFEIGLLLAGAFLVLRLAFAPAQRARWLGVNRLPAWPLAPAEFAALVLLVFACGFLLQAGMRILLGNALSTAADRAGLEVFFYGTAAHVGGLLGWMLFPALRRHWEMDTGTAPPAPAASAPGLPWSKVLLYGAATVLMAFPVLLLLNLGWMALLHKLGLPDEPQDLIAIFSNTKSPPVIAGLLLVACVVAPLNEELLFRAGLYRFCRQRISRGWALAICGVLFGAVHANLAGFLPLALLGAGLALAYEATGDIRVTIVAHGLFNLINTIFVFSSFPQ